MFLPSVLRPVRPFLRYLLWADPPLPPVTSCSCPGPVTVSGLIPYRPASVLILSAPKRPKAGEWARDFLRSGL